MATKTEICNDALIEVGAQPVEAVPGTTVEGELCNRVYDSELAKLLEDGPELGWKFANKRVQVAVNAVAPPFGFLYKYQRPADALKVFLVGIGSNSVSNTTTNVVISTELTDWVREGDFVLTSQEDTQVNMVYGTLETDTAKFPVNFRKLLSLNIAKIIGHRLTADFGERDRIVEDIRAQRVLAFAVDGDEQFVREENNDWQDAGHITEWIR